MNAGYIFQLRKPCQNRGLDLQVNNDGTVTINGTVFYTMRECDDYLESIPRKDIQGMELLS